MSLPFGGNPGKISGKLIGLTINGEFVSCETSCEFNWNVEMLPASAVTSGRWREYIAGIRDWNMTVNGNLLLASVGADVKTVLNAVMTGEEVELEFRTRSLVSPYLIISGKALPQSGNISAPVAGKANWNIQFQGTGPFATDFEQFWLIINAQPFGEDKPYIIDTTV